MKKVQEPIRLSMEAEIWEIKEDILKNVQHGQRNFILVEEAYMELQRGYGHSVGRSTCANCVTQYNKIMGNWIRQMEAKGLTPAAKTMKPKVKVLAGNNQDNILLPIEQRRKELEQLSFNDLKELLEDGAYQTLNEGKRPSKKAIINHLLGL